ncbi:hypothetical protein [Deminuibacter soli]|uniref:SWIM-type domain-containing protein n=1 Tax=Deminuibacter soli TaxID=2291815 RepID=A0A3E1NQI7_9BACT|nr:hypothetical protein [Deminuibacter soli]RFM30084.1 hypothetical protein DXN05_03675 [Deminuibacter soli]
MANRIGKDDLRNTKEFYPIRLGFYGALSEGDLKRHIDNDTLVYKHWHLQSLNLQMVTRQGFIFSNSNGSIRYSLTLKIEANTLYIACDCDRRVERLCHHACNALKHLISIKGESVFSGKLA